MTGKLHCFLTLLVVILLLAMLNACTKQEEEETTLLSTTNFQTTQNQTTSKDIQSETDTNYQIDTYIYLRDSNTTIDGDGVTFENNVLTITKGGTYQISGTLSDGQIYINSTDTQNKVKLYLDSVNVYCSTSAPLFVESSPRETVLILAQNSENVFSDNANCTTAQDAPNYATAAIYSKDDLQIEGSGILTVKGNFDKGIFTKDDLQLRGGTINITSVADGLKGKDSLEISDGIINITCDGDAISTSNEQDDGDILITGGTMNLNCKLDAIAAVGSLEITAGTINAVTAGGSSEDMSDLADKLPMGFAHSGRPGENSSEQVSSAPSTKAIKADKDITIKGGTFLLDCVDDAIHSNEDLSIEGGVFTIKTNDDAIHCEYELEISGGTFNIERCYEGIEGEQIEISGGEINIVATDDGINAASASEQSENPAFNRNEAPPQPNGVQTKNTAEKPGKNENPRDKGGFKNKGGFGGGMDDYDSDCIIKITGGTICINAEGDGIDSNGDVEISNATVIVYGPQNGGNGALDYAGTLKVTSGLLLAVGSAEMAQGVSDGSIASLGFRCSVNANTVMTIRDSSSNEIISFVAPKKYSSVVLACSSLKDGETYGVYTGGESSQQAQNGVYSKNSIKGGTLLTTQKAS